MGWLFEKLVEIVSQGISMLLSLLAISVTNIYKLDGTDTLHYFFGVFSGNTTGVDDAGPFGEIYRLFLYTGLAIIFFGMLYNLFKAFFGPLTQAEPPTRTILKAIFFAALCGYSQGIVALILDITKIPYDAMITASSDGYSFVNSMLDFGGHMLSTVPTAGIDLVLSVWKNAGGLLFSPNVWITVVCIILFGMLFKNMLMLILEMAERYLMVGLLTIIAPLCIACGAVKAVEDVFKNWLSWMINACVVLIMNTFFMCTFIFNFKAYCDIPYLCLWITFLKAGQKIDEHMNALGLKTAKTGGFGLDVMNALRSGLPMALGAADKFTGTNMAGNLDWARRGMQGEKPRISQNDARKGQYSDNLAQKALKSGLNAAGKAAAKVTGNKDMEGLGDKWEKANHKSAEATAIAAGKIGNKLANALPGHNEKHSGRRGFNESEINDMLSGKSQLPAKGTKAYDDTMKDMMDMKGGKPVTDALEKAGYKLTGMKEDQDGNINFTAEDKDGNKVAGTLSEGKPARESGLIGITGEDGQERGLAYSEQQVEGKENPLNLSGLGAPPSDDAAMAAPAGSNIMGADGEVAADGQQVQVGDANYNLSAPDENGIMTGVNENDPNDVKSFTADENGKISEVNNGESVGAAEFSGDTIQSGGEALTVQTDENGNIARDENGNILATDTSGATRAFKEDGQGGLQEVSSAQAGDSISFSDENGNQFTSNSALPEQSGAFTAVDNDGNQKSFYKSEDGSISEASTKTDGTIGAGKQVAGAADVTTNQDGIATSGGKTYSLSQNADGNSYTGTATDGSTAQFTKNGDGTMTMAQASDTISVKDNKGNSYTALSDGKGNYTSTNSIGEKTHFAKGSDGQFYKTGTTSPSGEYSSAREAVNSDVKYLGGQAGGSGVTVQSTGGDFVRTVDQRRYDQYGKECVNGAYMKTEGTDGSINLFQAKTTSNGAIETYSINDSARLTRLETPTTDGKPSGVYMDAKSFGKEYSDNIDSTYSAANASSKATAATNVLKGDEMYAYSQDAVPAKIINNGVQTTGFLQPRYLQMSGGKFQKLDMTRCEFDSNGYLMKDSPIFLEGQEKSIDWKDMKNTDYYTDGNAPRLYTEAQNIRNGQTSQVELHEGKECYASGHYMNGISMDLDWGSATLRNGHSLGYANNTTVASFPNGEQVMIMPENSRTNGMQGAYAELPSGLFGEGDGYARVFLAAMPANRIQSSVNDYCRSIGKNAEDITKTISIKDTNSKDFKLLARNCGINDVTSISDASIAPSPIGPVLQYSQKDASGTRRDYIVSGMDLEGNGYSESMRAIGGNSIVGYKKEVAPGEPIVAKIYRKNPMRIFQRKNQSFEEDRRR